MYSQAGTLVLVAENQVCAGRRGRCNVLECLSRTIPRVCRSSAAAETRGLSMLTDSMEFFKDLLRDILGTRCVPLQQQAVLRASGISWPGTVVTDARDVYGRLAKETGGLPEQKALTMEIALVREWLVTTGSEVRWTADENMLANGLTKDHEMSRRHLARVLSSNVWSIEKDALLVRSAQVDGIGHGRRARKSAADVSTGVR